MTVFFSPSRTYGLAAWIGLTREKISDYEQNLGERRYRWKWHDNAVSYKYDSSDNKYWNNDQPGKAELCAGLIGRHWHGFKCDQLNYCVCEYSMDTTVEATDRKFPS